MSTRRERLGRRGASLLVYGLIYFVSGLPLLVTPPSYLWHVLPFRVWAAGFVISGATAIAFSSRRTPAGDAVGFMALTIMGTMWAIRNLIFYGDYLLTGHAGGDWSLLVQAVTTALLVVKINIDAGWSEPHPPVIARKDGGR